MAVDNGMDINEGFSSSGLVLGQPFVLSILVLRQLLQDSQIQIVQVRYLVDSSKCLTNLSLLFSCLVRCFDFFGPCRYLVLVILDRRLTSNSYNVALLLSDEY